MWCWQLLFRDGCLVLHQVCRGELLCRCECDEFWCVRLMCFGVFFGFEWVHRVHCLSGGQVPERYGGHCLCRVSCGQLLAVKWEVLLHCLRGW